MKKVRFNADIPNSRRLRKVKAEYVRKHYPAKISLDSLANLAISFGLDNVRRKLNLSDC